jgi:cold shock protein
VHRHEPVARLHSTTATAWPPAISNRPMAGLSATSGCGSCPDGPEAPGFQGDRRMAAGTVKWFNVQKGFGFIQPEDGGKDVFVHITAVQAAGLNGLDENQRVTYEVVTERGKQAAANLRLA